MKIADFARERGVEISAVHKYLERNPELKNKCERSGNKLILTPEVLKVLDEQYPLPKPITIVNGVPEEEHREVLEKLATANEKLSLAYDKMLEMQKEIAEQKLINAQNEANMMLLEDKKEYLEQRMQEQEQEQQKIKTELLEQEQENRKLKEEIERLRSRSLFDRIFNK